MNNIDNYMSPAEAADRWGIPFAALKEKLRGRTPAAEEKIDHMLRNGMIKYYLPPGGQRKDWIISMEAMQYWYGDPKKNAD